MLRKEFLIVYLNLLKTIIGCGMLTYPFLLQKYGLTPTFSLTTISAFFSVTGLLLYTECNRKIGKSSTMSSISLYIIPKIKIIVDVCVVLKCYAVGVFYILILKEIIISLLTFLLKTNNNVLRWFGNIKSNLVLLFLLLISAPFSYFNELTKLRFASFFGMLLVLFILIFNVYTYFKTIEITDLKMYTGNTDYFKNLGKFVYGYTCHQNIFTIQNELKEKKQGFLNTIIVLALVTTLIIYMFFGIINVKIFGERCETNILKQYTNLNSSMSFFVLLFYAIMILLSFPFQVVPCRIYTISLFGKRCDNTVFKYLYTTFLLTSSYILAISKLNVDSMLNYIGGSVSALICFIFGPIYYLKLEKQRPIFRFFAIITFMFGLLVICGFIVNTWNS